MKLRDFKLRTKQMAGFGIILIIMAADHMFSARNMGTLKAEIDEISKNWLPRAIAIADINLNTAKLRLNQLQQAYTSGPKQKQRQLSEAITFVDKINDNIDTYNELKSAAEQKQLYSEEERRLYADFDDKWDEYQALSFEIFQLSRENQNQEAIALLNNQAKEVYDALSNNLVELVDVNKQDSFEAAKRAEKTYKSTHKIMTTVYVVTILLSVLIALGLVHYITGPVRQLEQAAGRVAKGTLDVHLEIASKDEIGNLADSFNQMTTALSRAKRQTEKQAKALKAQNKELAQAMSELQETQEQLLMKEKMAALGDLVAGVAHEINNPISAVNSSVEVSGRCLDKIERLLNSDIQTESKYGQQLPKTLRILKQSMSSIQAAGARISTIVKSLKNFSRLDEAEFQKVDIHEGIESSLTLLGSELPNRISIVKEYGELPKISCFPGQLNQVFINLLKNASKAIEGSGTICIRTYRQNHDAHVQIIDTGRGIPGEKLENIFDFGFSRAERRIKMSSGLSTSYSIVQKHHGEIRVQSEVGRGTTFSIILPLE
ncbi:MCP four helix bundle domain-containing protein [bacterium]|nr:MCP four helix bundle domain-containing protein [bacterium]